MLQYSHPKDCEELHMVRLVCLENLALLFALLKKNETTPSLSQSPSPLRLSVPTQLLVLCVELGLSNRFSHGI